MTSIKIVTENKKINENEFITILLIDENDITKTINQVYEENKINIINLNYEKETNFSLLCPRFFLTLQPNLPPLEDKQKKRIISDETLVISTNRISAPIACQWAKPCVP